MEYLIKGFLAIGDGSGSGSGYGSGYGYGDGYGYGYGSGYGYGDGSGYGYGSGDGYGDGSGSGDGDGYGYGDGSGSGYGDGSGSGDGDGSGSGDGSGYGSGDGYGDGDGSGIFKYNGQKVYEIDSMQTVIEAVKGNYAKGYIISEDLTTKPCYIAKAGDYFAHGDTLKEAQESALQKYNQNLSEEERIEMFQEQFKGGKEYPAKMFFDWHNILTGSCDFGRKEFCRVNNIDIKNDKITVSRFFDLTKNSYGGDIIKKLILKYQQ